MDSHQASPCQSAVAMPPSPSMVSTTVPAMAAAPPRMPTPAITPVETAVPPEISVGLVTVIGIGAVSVRLPSVVGAVIGITIAVRYAWAVSGIYGTACHNEEKLQQCH